MPVSPWWKIINTTIIWIPLLSKKKTFRTETKLKQKSLTDGLISWIEIRLWKDKKNTLTYNKPTSTIARWMMVRSYHIISWYQLTCEQKKIVLERKTYYRNVTIIYIIFDQRLSFLVLFCSVLFVYVFLC